MARLPPALRSWWQGVPDAAWAAVVAREAPLMAGRCPRGVAETLCASAAAQGGQLQQQQLRGPVMTRRGGSPVTGVQWQ